MQLHQTWRQMKGGVERRGRGAVLHEVRWGPLPRAIWVPSPRRYPSSADPESVAHVLDFVSCPLMRCYCSSGLFSLSFAVSDVGKCFVVSDVKCIRWMSLCIVLQLNTCYSVASASKELNRVTELSPSTLVAQYPCLAPLWPKSQVNLRLRIQAWKPYTLTAFVERYLLVCVPSSSEIDAEIYYTATWSRSKWQTLQQEMQKELLQNVNLHR